MAFNDEDKTVFPTRYGLPIGSGGERVMLSKVGGADVIRSETRTNADGTSTLLRTRGGFPIFSRSSKESGDAETVTTPHGVVVRKAADDYFFTLGAEGSRGRRAKKPVQLKNKAEAEVSYWAGYFTNSGGKKTAAILSLIDKVVWTWRSWLLKNWEPESLQTPATVPFISADKDYWGGASIFIADGKKIVGMSGDTLYGGFVTPWPTTDAMQSEVVGTPVISPNGQAVSLLGYRGQGGSQYVVTNAIIDRNQDNNATTKFVERVIQTQSGFKMPMTQSLIWLDKRNEIDGADPDGMSLKVFDQTSPFFTSWSGDNGLVTGSPGFGGLLVGSPYDIVTHIGSVFVTVSKLPTDYNKDSAFYQHTTVRDSKTSEYVVVSSASASRAYDTQFGPFGEEVGIVLVHDKQTKHNFRTVTGQTTSQFVIPNFADYTGYFQIGKQRVDIIKRTYDVTTPTQHNIVRLEIGERKIELLNYRYSVVSSGRNNREEVTELSNVYDSLPREKMHIDADGKLQESYVIDAASYHGESMVFTPDKTNETAYSYNYGFLFRDNARTKLDIRDAYPWDDYHHGLTINKDKSPWTINISYEATSSHIIDGDVALDFYVMLRIKIRYAGYFASDHMEDTDFGIGLELVEQRRFVSASIVYLWRGTESEAVLFSDIEKSDGFTEMLMTKASNPFVWPLPDTEERRITLVFPPADIEVHESSACLLNLRKPQATNPHFAGYSAGEEGLLLDDDGISDDIVAATGGVQASNRHRPGKGIIYRRTGTLAEIGGLWMLDKFKVDPRANPASPLYDEFYVKQRTLEFVDGRVSGWSGADYSDNVKCVRI